MKAVEGHEPTLRTVSAMTAALAGYASFSSAHEPELVAATVQQFYEAVTEQVFTHDGTLIGYRGGSLSAIWNAPHDQDDHPLRAARAAFAIAALDGSFGAMRVSVGVATGSVMVGILGSSLRRAYMAVGKPMTDSDRLSSVAGPGEAYIDEPTWNGSKGRLKADAITGMQRVGGITREETVYRLVVG